MTDNYEVLDMRLVPRRHEEMFNFPQFMPQFYEGIIQNKTNGRKVIVCGICNQNEWDDPLSRPALERTLIAEAKNVEELSP